MAYIFLAIIILFTLLAGSYLSVNDFAKETLPVIFPSIGAILLSIYLGIKLIYLDAPSPVQFYTSTAILHDIEKGQINVMTPSIKRRLDIVEFRGAELLKILLLSNEFKHLNNPEFFKSNPDDIHEGSAYKLILHMLEYVIIQWLNKDDVTVGYTPGKKIYLMHGGSGSHHHKVNNIPIPVSMGKEESNPLIKTKDPGLKLPKNSKIVRSGSTDWPFGFELKIVTCHTEINIHVYDGGGETVSSRPLEPETELIYNSLNLPKNTENIYMHGFIIEFEATQYKSTRFSQQAKLEMKWVKRLKEQLEKDFSWEKLRKLHANG